MEESSAQWSPSPSLLADLYCRAQQLGVDIETYVWMLLEGKVSSPQTAVASTAAERNLASATGFVFEMRSVSARDADGAAAYFAPGGSGHIEDCDKAIEDGREAAV